MPIYPYEGIYPKIGNNCFIAATAVLIGDVTLEDGANVWYGCVLRGDVAPIVVGKRSNIQDNTVIHGEFESPTTIGADVTVGHSAIIHAATVGDRVLVGMGAVLLSRCRIASDTVLGARALVPEDRDVPGGSLVLGMPGKVVRALNDDEKAAILDSAQHYVHYAEKYMRAESQENGGLSGP